MNAIKGHFNTNQYRPAIWSILVGVVIGIAFYISSNWYQIMLIQGKSMEPSYHHMQMVLLDKHTKKYKVGDVVAFYCEGLDSVLVKRIVAGPMETVQITDMCLYVDDKVEMRYKDSLFEYAGILDKKVHLESGQYIVIGDNINQSKDSRYNVVGVIDTRNILGIVVNGSK